MTTEVYTTEKNLKKFHHEILIWKSTLKFIKVETNSISQLLNSFEYEPATANLFEQLLDYRQEVTSMKEDVYFNRKVYQSFNPKVYHYN